MVLENKVIGIVFINNLIIKDNLKYELIKLKSIKNVTLVPIMNLNGSNNNIEIISKITKFKPLFYDKDIILEKTIKNLDILILIGCSYDLIYKLAINKFNNNILKIIKNCKKSNKTIIFGIDIKNFNFSSFNAIDKLYNKSKYYFIPLKITNPITKPDNLSFDPSLIIKTASLATEKIQIKPILSFL